VIFRDREHAGQKLAEKLTEYADCGDVLILALPRGGVPVAYEVAKALIAPLDVFLVRKLGVPGHEELAMGAIASGGTRVLNETVVGPLHIPAEVIDAVAEKEERELLRREREYRNSLPPLQISGHTVILVDDGLATGATMRAAAQAIKKLEPRRLVIAVPVSAPETCDELEAEADAIICATMPQPFYGVGMWYRDFSQTSDQEVKELLESNRNRMARRANGRGS
jgi:putative phosphoribosyl transferase